MLSRVPVVVGDVQDKEKYLCFQDLLEEVVNRKGAKHSSELGSGVA